MDVSLPDLVSCRLLDYIFPACIKLYISYRCVQTSISRLSACTQSKLEILRFFLIFHLWFTLFLWFRTETINIFGVKMEIALCWVKLVAGGTLKIGWDCWSCVHVFLFPLLCLQYIPFWTGRMDDGPPDSPPLSKLQPRSREDRKVAIPFNFVLLVLSRTLVFSSIRCKRGHQTPSGSPFQFPPTLWLLSTINIYSVNAQSSEELTWRKKCSGQLTFFCHIQGSLALLHSLGCLIQKTLFSTKIHFKQISLSLLLVQQSRQNSTN